MVINQDFINGLTSLLTVGLLLMSFFTLINMITCFEGMSDSKKSSDANPRYFYLKGLLAITFLTLALIIDLI